MLLLVFGSGTAVAQPADLPGRLATRWGPGWALTTIRPDDPAARVLIRAPGLHEDETEALVAEIAALESVDPDELVLGHVVSHRERSGTRELRRFDRYWHGVRVVEDEVLVVITDGRIGAVWLRLGAVHVVGEPRAGEQVVRLPGGSTVLARPVTRPDRIEWLDRKGRVVRVDPMVFTDALTVTYEARGPGDPLVTAPARGVTVTDAGGNVDVTDEEGTTALSAPFDVAIDGPRLTVWFAGEIVAAAGVDDGDLLGGTDVIHEAASILAHYDRFRDWLAARWSDAEMFDEYVDATADDPLYPCNAYYAAGTDHFGFSPELGGACPAFARYGDVVLHEAGHRVHWTVLAGGTFTTDVSEGSADYMAATVNDDPVFAPGIYGRDTYIREIDTDRRYPEDENGEPHNDGLIWGSFLWNLRAQWVAELGDLEGVDATDRLLLRVLEQGPRMNDLWAAVLVADDDDGDLANGTPRDCDLLALLEHHGLGPGSLGATAIAHAPPMPGSADAAYPVSFRLPPAYPRCGEQTIDRVTLRWSVDRSAPLPALGDDDPAWPSLELTAVGDRFEGELPRQPANTEILYFIEFARTDGQAFASHRDAHGNLWSFWVGDRRVVWCDDFEGDLSGWQSDVGVPFRDDVPETAINDWEFGSPTGIGAEPTSAPSGQFIAATSLAGNYLPNNAEQLLSPPIDLDGRGVMRLLQLQRWLSVEDGVWDKASVWGERPDGAGWELLWSNEPTVWGITHHADGEWKLCEHALAPALAPDGSHDGPLRIGFTLESDSNAEFAGWAIDDPCIVELEDPEGHYRVRDFAAEVRPNGLDVALRWTTPWIRPITNVRVVRRLDEAPTGADDGVVAATPDRELWQAGTAIAMTEFGVDPGRWHYAVFLAGSGGPNDWWETVVEGGNAAVVTIEGAPEPEDAGATDEDAGPPDAGSGGDDGGGGCGCRTAGSAGAPGGAVAAFALLALALVCARRRIALLALVALASPGCGDDDDDGRPDAAVEVFDAALDAALDAEGALDAGADAAAPAPDGCGRWAGIYVGRRRTYHYEGWTSVDFPEEILSFGDDGAIQIRHLEPGENGAQREFTYDYRCEPDGLYDLGYGYRYLNADGSTAAESYVANSAPALILPRDLAPGDDWSFDVMRQSEREDGTLAEWQFAGQFTVEEEQFVSTTAGSWRALRVLSGVGTPENRTFTWWAEDVGKALEISWYQGSRSWSELIALDDTDRLP